MKAFRIRVYCKDTKILKSAVVINLYKFVGFKTIAPDTILIKDERGNSEINFNNSIVYIDFSQTSNKSKCYAEAIIDLNYLLSKTYGGANKGIVVEQINEYIKPYLAPDMITEEINKN